MKLVYDTYTPKNVPTRHKCPIVLVHSMMESRKTWRALGQPIADQTGRKVYAPDCRSHGDSPWTDEYNYDALVEDLEEFLKEHKISKTILVGHSMGGRIVLGYTLQHPDKVEALVVEDVPAKELKQRLQNMAPAIYQIAKDVFSHMSEFDNREAIEKWLRSMMHTFEDLAKISPEVIDTYDFNLLPFKWNGKTFDLEINIKAVGDALLANRMEQKLSGKFERDALFIYGGSSQFRVGQDKLVEHHFPRATRVEVKNAGHFIHSTMPDVFLKEMVNFINQTPCLKSKF